MPRQHRLRPTIEVAQAALTTLFLPRHLGRIPALPGDLRRATVGATDPLGPPQLANGFIALDIVQQILKVDHRGATKGRGLENSFSVARGPCQGESFSTVWNPY